MTYTWSGHKTTGQKPVSGGTCTFTTSQIKPTGFIAWKDFGGTGSQCPSGSDVLDGPAPQPSQVLITIPVTTTTYGPCGPVPPGATGNGNSSTRCVIVEWKGSTVTDDYPQDKLDNIRVIRLCDPTLRNCLDQRPNLAQ